ncbi:MAG: substrate-binding domain-containing protein, partial [Candidatus Thiodiazotropha sp.]
AEREKICRSLRRDNHVVNSAKREDVTIGWVEDDDSRHAITSFTNYMIYSDKLDASLIEGVEPTYETISNQRYPLVTGLYVYVKDQHKQHLPNLQNFLYELTSERALAPEGYLAEDGLVTLDDIGRNKARDMVLEFGM